MPGEFIFNPTLDKAKKQMKSRVVKTKMMAKTKTKTKMMAKMIVLV